MRLKNIIEIVVSGAILVLMTLYVLRLINDDEGPPPGSDDWAVWAGVHSIKDRVESFWYGDMKFVKCKNALKQMLEDPSLDIQSFQLGGERKIKPGQRLLLPLSSGWPMAPQHAQYERYVRVKGSTNNLIRGFKKQKWTCLVIEDSKRNIIKVIAGSDPLSDLAELFHAEGGIQEKK